MNVQNHCQSCGQPLAADTPGGLCPACLMKVGLGTATGAVEHAPMTSAPSHFVPPSLAELSHRFPQYDFLERIGQGGMGAVYKARQKSLDRIVALKILAPRRETDPHFAERFALEARTLARLSHPNIISVFDFGQAEGHYYLVMEYVEGVNLRQLLRTGKLQPKEALAIVPELCAALQYAHDQGIVHRDIKPENIMLDRQGRVKIADFGLVKLLGLTAPQERLTQPKDVMGTPHYMAPEQIEHPQEVDHRADIFSLGVVFYEMLTGELPLGKFALPSHKVHIDVRLDEVVLRALEKEPERRYQQASQVRSDVETIATTWTNRSRDGETSTLRSSTPTEDGARRREGELSSSPANILDDSSTGSGSMEPHPEATTAQPPDPLPPAAQAIQGRLRWVSLLLLVIGLLPWLETLVVLIVPLFSPDTLRPFFQFIYRYDTRFIPNALQVLNLHCVGELIGTLTLIAAWRVRKCRGFTIANVAILLSFLIFFHLHIAGPLGLLALILIWRKDVRAAFLDCHKRREGPAGVQAKQQESYRLALASSALVLVSFLCLPAFQLGTSDISPQAGLAHVLFQAMRWLPRWTQSIGMVLGMLALLSMRQTGSPANAAGWAVLGTLFPPLLWFISRRPSQSIHLSWFAMEPGALEPTMTQNFWNALVAVLVAGSLAWWVAHYQRKLRQSSASKADTRCLKWTFRGVSVVIIGYVGFQTMGFYAFNHFKKEHLVSLFEASVVAMMIGWLIYRRIKPGMNLHSITVLKRLTWTCWTIAIGIVAYTLIAFLSVQYLRPSLQVNLPNEPENIIFLENHAHQKMFTESETAAFAIPTDLGEIKLQSISEPAAREVTCWLPDGTIQCLSQPQSFQPVEKQTDIRDLIFYVMGSGNTILLKNLHWECFVLSQGIEKNCPKAYLPSTHRLPSHIQGILITVPAEALTARLRLGWPAESWEDTDAVWVWTGDSRTLKKKSIRHSGEDWEFSLSRIAEVTGGLTITCIMPLKRNADARLIALDTQGNIVEPLHAQHFSGLPYSPELVDRNTYCMVVLPGITLNQLKELRFQVRPYQWVEFRNISLQPGKRTQVEVAGRQF